MSDVGGPQNVSNASFTISDAGVTAIGNSNGAWTLYMHDDGNKDFGGLASLSLKITTDESTAALVGTPDDDVIFVTTTNAFAGEGVFQINERGGVAYTGVHDFTEVSGAGNDLIIAGSAVDRIFAGTGRDSVYGGGRHRRGRRGQGRLPVPQRRRCGRPHQ
jgi:hypothetical protein